MVQGQSPGGGLGRRTQKPETRVEYSTKQCDTVTDHHKIHTLQISYTLKKFPATTGDMQECPVDYATGKKPN